MRLYVLMVAAATLERKRRRNKTDFTHEKDPYVNSGKGSHFLELCKRKKTATT